MTLNNLRLTHPIQECEFIVVDTEPDGPHGERLRNFVGNINAGIKNPWLWQNHPLSARYVRSERGGTAYPRDLVFREAQGEAVLVMDSHVHLFPGAIEKLLEYYAANPDSKDLLHGPLIMDCMAGVRTHMDDMWRYGMWGAWGADERGFQSNQEPFEIPAHGLGVFSCRKDAWLGFNPRFKDYGGEEFYIHEKFRQAGRKVVCLPFLRWLHRTGEPDAGRQYPNSPQSMAANYVEGHRELGLPLDRLRKHYVDGLDEDTGNEHPFRIPERDWEQMTQLKEGPGTRLKRILESIGIETSPDCPCMERMRQMDAWGTACVEHRDEIIGWIRQGMESATYRQKVMAAARSITTGLALGLNPFDPAPGLVDAAIKGVA